MNKAEFIAALSEKTGMPKATTEKFLKSFDETVISGLKDDGKVRIGDLGFLNIAYRAPRDGKNPKDPSKLYHKEESATATFKPSEALRTTVNAPDIIASAKAKANVEA